MASKKGDQVYPFLSQGQVYRFEMKIDDVRYVDMSSFPSLSQFYDAESKLLIRRVINRQDRLMATYYDRRMVFKKDLNPFIVTSPGFDALYLLGIVNSRLFSYLYVNISSIATKDDFRQTTLAELRKMPVPVQRSSKKTAAIIPLVQQMLDLHERLAKAKTAHDQTALQRQIDATDRQIDQLVYELYGLTDDEIRLVEEATV